ncbi:unnamed protein product, partial [Mesorhabditis belari]|uniref:Uncharacterized protein n=1 Tax=Mesorhabditis belari TaxID=2138241 RepID=A0AAF3EQ35_9BILA
MLSTSKFLLFSATIGTYVIFSAPVGLDLRDDLKSLNACRTDEVEKQIEDDCGKLEKSASCEKFGEITRCTINHLKTLCHMENAGEVLLGVYKLITQEVHADPERKKCIEDFHE